MFMLPEFPIYILDELVKVLHGIEITMTVAFVIWFILRFTGIVPP